MQNCVVNEVEAVNPSQTRKKITAHKDFLQNIIFCRIYKFYREKIVPIVIIIITKYNIV